MYIRLGYMDIIEEASKVREETLKKQDKKIIKATMYIDELIYWNGTLFETYHKQIIEEAIKPTSPSLDYGPLEEFILQAKSELEASLFLVMHGYIKQAIALLRVALDLILIGTFFQNNRQEYQKILNKLVYQPYKKRDLIDKNLNNSPLKEFDTKNRIREKIEDIHNNLSKFTHTTPSAKHKITGSGSNSRYDEELFNKWYDYLNEIYIIASILLILHYPSIFKQNSKDANEILNRFANESKEWFNEIQLFLNKK